MAAGRVIRYEQVVSKLPDERYLCPPGWVLGHGTDYTSPINNVHVVNH